MLNLKGRLERFKPLVLSLMINRFFLLPILSFYSCPCHLFSQIVLDLLHPLKSFSVDLKEPIHLIGETRILNYRLCLDLFVIDVIVYFLALLTDRELERSLYSSSWILCSNILPDRKEDHSCKTRIIKFLQYVNRFKLNSTSVKISYL